MAPKPPFVEVAHEHAIRSDALEQPLDLDASLPRAQPQMRGDDLHGHPATGYMQIDRTAGLIRRYTEIHQPNLSTLAAGEDCVAVMAFALQQRGTGDDLILGFFSQPMREFQAMPIRSIDFLHRNHVRV